MKSNIKNRKPALPARSATPSVAGGRHSDTPILPHSHTSSSSFTLLEVLVSMTIITVIVLMVANMFQNASVAWNIGTRKAEVNTAGRAAVEFMARELSQAVAGPIDKSQSDGADYLPFKVQLINYIRFLALDQDPGDECRALRGIYFWFEDNQLEYAYRSSSLNCYLNTWDQGRPDYPQGTLIENVLDLQFLVYGNETDLANGNYTNTFPATCNNLPFCVDIFLELISGDDMKTANSLSGTNRTAFIDRNAKCYSTRVYFPNREGYLKR